MIPTVIKSSIRLKPEAGRDFETERGREREGFFHGEDVMTRTI